MMRGFTAVLAHSKKGITSFATEERPSLCEGRYPGTEGVKYRNQFVTIGLVLMSQNSPVP
jgi:hypothetical protein